jgi:SAM-dependent methyltransferase
LEEAAMTVDLGAYQKRWSEGVCLDPGKDLATNFVDELEAYSGLPRAEVERLFSHGTEEFAKEWLERYQHAPDSRTRFYDESFTHIFFVMHNSALRAGLSSPYLYLYALDVAKRLGLRRYLDYGAGTASAATLFARDGFDTTVADISSRMLDFARWRFERRGLSAAYLDVKHDPLPRESFDLITCFHVLQHLEDPVAKMRELRGALKPGGILIINGGLTKDPERPMQPDHGGLRTTRKFRSVGLQMLWDHTRAMRALSNTGPKAYQRVERPELVNRLYYVFDTTLTSSALRRAIWLAAQPAVQVRKGLRALAGRA